MMEPGVKEEELLRILSNKGSLAIAFSGGVDSSYLLYAANKASSGKCHAFTISSPLLPLREKKAASEFAGKLGVKHEFLAGTESGINKFSENNRDRCYFCKKNHMEIICEKAAELNIEYIATGVNTDDFKDYRPGNQALEELDIKMPLAEAGMGKEDIRFLSKKAGLDTWNKPSMACLASRIPYGTPITENILSMVEKGEDILWKRGLRVFRLRYHGTVARIEAGKKEMALFEDSDFRKEIIAAFKEIGFLYTALDLEGYFQGSLNKELIGS